MVFDEFQEIASLNGEAIEKGMRACFQHHDLVSYLFAGSRRHIISDMVTNKRRAFYNMGKVMPLGKIPVEEFKIFYEESAWRILTYHVNEAIERIDLTQLDTIRLDEISVKKGHKYITLFYDIKNAKVIYIEVGKGKNTIKKFKDTKRMKHSLKLGLSG